LKKKRKEEGKKEKKTYTEQSHVYVGWVHRTIPLAVWGFVGNKNKQKTKRKR
jgi:hypothetical protein